MKKETKYFMINYTNNDVNYIDDVCIYLEKEIEKVVNFFGLNEFGEKIVINLYNNIETLRDIHNKLYKTNERDGKVSEWISGFFTRNVVHTLCIDEYRKTTNNEDTDIERLEKLILHESIHSIHSKVNKKFYLMAWLSEGLANTLSHQYDDVEFKFDASLEQVQNGGCCYYNYNAMFMYVFNNYGRDYILKLINNDDFLIEQTPKLYEEVKKSYIKKYLNQNIDNPRYLFHGSPNKLDKIVPKQSHDSNNNTNNIAKAIFLFPSFLKSTPYAFKETIKENSKNLKWNFDIPNNNTYPLMKMQNVNIDENIIGYIYVFKKDDDMIKDEESYQYKCYKELIPYDVIEIKYKDFSKYYEIEEQKEVKKYKK